MQRHGSLERRISSSGSSLYRILELPESAPPEAVRKAYKRLALKYHPDKNPGDPITTEKFKEVNRAYKILTDERKREIYEKYGSLGIHIAERFGEENVHTYFMIKSPWFKFLFVLSALVTCCFCACCCFCCCNCCCGRCRHKFYAAASPDDSDDELSEFACDLQNKSSDNMELFESPHYSSSSPLESPNDQNNYSTTNAATLSGPSNTRESSFFP